MVAGTGVYHNGEHRKTIADVEIQRFDIGKWHKIFRNADLPLIFGRRFDMIFVSSSKEVVMERVRIIGIDLVHFKNVYHGAVAMSKGHNADFSCSVLGVYGQNGSGKTALVDSLQILKHLLSQFPCCSTSDLREWVHYINVESKSSELTWTFRFDDDKGDIQLVEYSVTLQKCEDCIAVEGSVRAPQIQFVNERIAVTSMTADERARKTVLIDTNVDGVFKPVVRFHSLVASDKKAREDLIVAKRLAMERSRSFVFSSEFVGVLERTAVEDNRQLKNVIDRLRYYGQYELFIVRTMSTGLISLNALPISFTYEQPQYKSTGAILIPLNEDSLVPQNAFDTAQVLIRHMNVVLCKLVPGLTIDLKNIGNKLLSDGSTGVMVQFVSLKNTQEIPLKYESEGIKKIISVLHLLIEMFNRPSTTVAIDELDSGVFEYLLGELLQIISDRGRGQLIFTSHNLRPLETLNRDMIVFTTTNPSKRYIRFRNVKSNNNLRDFYYRGIMLGGQVEEVYSRTNNSDIAYAFMAAGELMNGESKGAGDVS